MRILIYILCIPLLTLSGFLGAGCSEEEKIVRDEGLEKGAQVKINKFYRQSLTMDGKMEWELYAEEAYIYQEGSEQSKIVAYNFSFEQFNPKGVKVASIKAVRGEINREKDKLYLTSNVSFKSDKNRTIYADEMEYDVEEKILTSKDPVVIQESGLYLKCNRGITYYYQEQKQVCRGTAGVHSRSSNNNGNEGVDDIFQ